MDCIIHEPFGTSDELLRALWRFDDRWQPWPDHWLFRGQGSAGWALQPSALRPTTVFPHSARNELRADRTHADQLRAEALTIHAFAKELDRQGIPPPTEAAYDWGDIYEVFGRLIDDPPGDNWPPQDIAPLFGMAQHHGIPTRLLDWTERPLVAAYFAALQGVQRAESEEVFAEEEIAVWALNYKDGQGLFTLLEEEPVFPSFSIIRPPRSTNPNLLAQGGAFSLVITKGAPPGGSPAMPSLEELIEKRYEMVWEHSTDRPILRKLTLPLIEAGKLLRLLNQDHVSAAHLFPGVDGAVRGLKERQYWDKPSS